MATAFLLSTFTTTSHARSRCLHHQDQQVVSHIHRHLLRVDPPMYRSRPLRGVVKICCPVFDLMLTSYDLLCNHPFSSSILHVLILRRTRHRYFLTMQLMISWPNLAMLIQIHLCHPTDDPSPCPARLQRPTHTRKELLFYIVPLGRLVQILTLRLKRGWRFFSRSRTSPEPRSMQHRISYHIH
jgi:hypothetical protein